MTFQETRNQLDAIARELMRLANANSGNSRELNVILAASIVLQGERESR